jgi:hypothetical protein
MEKLKYKDLTPEEKRKICNGCGGKGGKINPPEFKFNASCNHHDFNYWRGHTESDRRKADKEFYKAMKGDARKLPWYRRSIHFSLAYIYYKAVRISGKKFFYYGPKYRDRSDINK